jgi:hypothetical protein
VDELEGTSVVYGVASRQGPGMDVAPRSTAVEHLTAAPLCWPQYPSPTRSNQSPVIVNRVPGTSPSIARLDVEQASNVTVSPMNRFVHTPKVMVATEPTQSYSVVRGLVHRDGVRKPDGG